MKKCEHEYGRYHPNGEPGPVLVCADCGVELDVITRQPKTNETEEAKK